MISVCIVGINQWVEYTSPLIEQIKQFEPDVNIVVVDNDSAVPYPEGDGYKTVRTLRTCYAEAINNAIEHAKADWYLVLNNDVKCHGKFKDIIEKQSPEALYGRQIITQDDRTWLGIWLALVSDQIWNDVGLFDSGFKMCGFEDADYCVRAADMGYPTAPIDLPFYHYWGKTRWGLPEYPKVRLENIDYFEKKHGYRLGNNMVVTHD